MSKIILWCCNLTALVGVALLGCYSFSKMQSDKHRQPNSKLTTAVRVMPVAAADIHEEVVLTATIKPYARVQIYAKVSGRLEELKVDQGTQVTKGQVIGIIDHAAQQVGVEQAEAVVEVARAQLLSAEENIKQAQAGLDAARAELQTLEVNLANIEKDYRRCQKLFAEGTLSRQNFDATETLYKANLPRKQACQSQIYKAQAAVAYAQAAKTVYQAQLQQAKAALKTAQVQLDETTLRATISGVVARKYSDQGDMLATKPLGDPVVDLVAIDRVKVLVEVPETYLPYIKMGMPLRITVDAYRDESHNGTITNISPVLNEATRTATIEITVVNPDHRLKPGMFCRVPLILRSHREAVVIPADAVIRQGGRYFVFIANGNTAKKVAVNIGIWSGARIEVKHAPGSLKLGDLLIVRGHSTLIDGSMITIVAKGES